MDSSAVLRSFQLGGVSQARSYPERPGMASTRKLHVQGLRISRKLISSTKQRETLVSCLKTPDTTKAVNSRDDISEGSLESNSVPTFPSGFEDLLLEVCDETEIAELKLKIGGFQMHMKRDIGAMKAPASFVSPTIAASPTIPSKPMDESITAPKVTPPSTPTPSSASMNPFKDDPEKKSLKLLAFESSGVTGHVYIPSTLVGSFLRGKKVKGRRTRHVLREGDFVKEGEVIGYVDQFGTVLPLRSDKDGEIVKVLLDDGDAVGYGDPVVAILPSFHSIKI